MRSSTPNVLMVYPRFNPDSFWNYQATCDVVGAKYSAAPLGLITVAAMLPPDWPVRLVNRNTEELAPGDLQWADMVMTGGMLPQQGDALEVMRLARKAGKPVVVGGTDVSSSPHVYDEADFRVIGEAEGIMGGFIAAWLAGDTRGDFKAEDFPDVTTSPVPRFDLLKLRQYMHVGVQVSRGCPFTCEFCNVIELNGRTPRVKTSEQVLRELTALYDVGYRGHVDFVDDNMIGNRRVIKPILADLAIWLEQHDYPFEFSTEASMNLADDDELLALMKRANFFAIFVGIETPDTDALLGAGKRQNTRRDIVASIRKIYGAGIFVNAGFIIGFDAEKDRMAKPMIACIEDAAIPIAMVGLLYALPNTQLWRRLTAEGRLHANSDILGGVEVADQCTSGLNFDTVRPRQDMIEDYRTVLREIYEPHAYYGRVTRVARLLDVSGHRVKRPLFNVLRDLRTFSRIGWRAGVLDRQSRGPFWRAIGDCLVHNPRAARMAVSFAALYLHLGPYARFLDARMAVELEEATVTSQSPLRSAGSRGAAKAPLPANG